MARYSRQSSAAPVRMPSGPRSDGIAGRAKEFVGQLVRDFSDHQTLAQAAAIAFFTALSFAPLVLLLTYLGRLAGEQVQYELLGQFSRQLGPNSEALAHGVLEAAHRASRPENGWRAGLSAAGLLLAASAVFGQLQSALNTIWDVAAAPTPLRTPHGRFWTISLSVWRWLRKRLISMGMVLIVLLILLVSLVVSAALGALLPHSDGKALARLIEFTLSFLVATLLFASIFKVLPDSPPAWRQVWVGAVLTSLLFNVGKLVLSVYIERAGVGKDYGEAVGSLVALLVWVYYSSVALLLGAEVTQRLARGRDAPATAAR